MSSFPIRLTPSWTTTALLFLALTGCYLCLSPATVGARGYVDEEVKSGLTMLSAMTAWLKDRPMPVMAWSRHGPLPVLLDLPFIRIGKEIISPDFLMSFQAVLLTAGLMTILFVWLRKICSPGMALLLTFTAAFGSMLWAYAYIGLEPKQSFFVLLAGYLGLANGRIESRKRLLLFAVVCGLAMSMKVTGITMWPAIAWLIYAQFRGEWKTRWKSALVVTAVIGAVWGAAALSWDLYWGPIGGGYNSLRNYFVDLPFRPFVSAIELLGSPVKGLIVHAPVLLLTIYAVPKAFRTHRDLVVFAMLLLLCTIGYLSLLRYHSDEVWGPRYLHILVAPLTLCIGAAWPRFSLRRDIPLLVLTTMGVAIAFLGAFFYYGTRPGLMEMAGENTMEAITADPLWNEVPLAARLFGVWWKGGDQPVPWTPTPLWAWTRPPWVPAEKSIDDLRKYAEPQSVMLRYWQLPADRTLRILVRFYIMTMVVGLLAFLVVLFRTVRESRVQSPEQDSCGAGFERLSSTTHD